MHPSVWIYVRNTTEGERGLHKAGTRYHSTQVHALFLLDFHQHQLFAIPELVFRVNSSLVLCEEHPFSNRSAITIDTGFHLRESTKFSRLYFPANVTSSTYTTVSWDRFLSDLIETSDFPVYSNDTRDLAKRNQDLTQRSESSGWAWGQQCAHQLVSEAAALGVAAVAQQSECLRRTHRGSEVFLSQCIGLA